jgi:flagella basal body P-ring formation protein FlgA
MRRFGFPLLFQLMTGIVLVMAHCVLHAAPLKTVVQIDLRADVTAREPRLTLADLAEVNAGNPQVKDAVQALIVKNAPRAGSIEQMTRQDIEYVLRSRMLDMGLVFEWGGARAIKIHTAERQLDANAMIEAARMSLIQSLRTKFEQVDAQPASAVAGLAVPIGAVSFKVRPIDIKHFYPRTPVWVDVYVNGSIYRSVAVSFNVRVNQTVYVAKRDLQEGGAMSIADFELKTADVSEIADEVMPVSAVGDSLYVRKTLRSGQILTRNHVASSEMVLRGDIVKLVLIEGAVQIEARAVAQQDAGIGQQIKVKLEKSTDLVLARVTSRGVVQADGR